MISSYQGLSYMRPGSYPVKKFGPSVAILTFTAINKMSLNVFLSPKYWLAWEKATILANSGKISES